AAEAAEFSNHSFWIGCATTLLAAGFSLDTIKRFCRWRSADCAIIYTQAGAEFYVAPMAALQLVGAARVAAAGETVLVDIDADELADGAIAAVQALVHAMAA
ncbi:hypothetical protein T492DRAFT_954008, partial [Pavlovales sp. CCMP2436]